MTREGLDFREVMRRDHDRRARAAFQESFDQLIAYEGIEAGERLVQDDQLGMVGER